MEQIKCPKDGNLLKLTSDKYLGTKRKIMFCIHCFTKYEVELWKGEKTTIKELKEE